MRQQLQKEVQRLNEEMGAAMEEGLEGLADALVPTVSAKQTHTWGSSTATWWTEKSGFEAAPVQVIYFEVETTGITTDSKSTGYSVSIAYDDGTNVDGCEVKLTHRAKQYTNTTPAIADWWGPVGSPEPEVLNSCLLDILTPGWNEISKDGTSAKFKWSKVANNPLDTTDFMVNTEEDFAGYNGQFTFTVIKTPEPIVSTDNSIIKFASGASQLVLGAAAAAVAASLF